MKKITKLLFVFGAITLFAATSQAQVVIRAVLRPPVVVERRPPPPSPRHVWVAEEWNPRGVSYAYRPGHWIEPPRPHAIWIGGLWVRHPRGWFWKPGHWR